MASSSEMAFSSEISVEDVESEELSTSLESDEYFEEFLNESEDRRYEMGDMLDMVLRSARGSEKDRIAFLEEVDQARATIVAFKDIVHNVKLKPRKRIHVVHPAHTVATWTSCGRMPANLPFHHLALALGFFFTIPVVLSFLVLTEVVPPYWSLLASLLFCLVAVAVAWSLLTEVIRLVVVRFDFWFLFSQNVLLFFVLWPFLLSFDVRSTMMIGWGLVSVAASFADAAVGPAKVSLRVVALISTFGVAGQMLGLQVGDVFNTRTANAQVEGYTWSIEALWFDRAVLVMIMNAKVLAYLAMFPNQTVMVKEKVSRSDLKWEELLVAHRDDHDDHMDHMDPMMPHITQQLFQEMFFQRPVRLTEEQAVIKIQENWRRHRARNKMLKHRNEQRDNVSVYAKMIKRMTGCCGCKLGEFHCCAKSEYNGNPSLRYLLRDLVVSARLNPGRRLRILVVLDELYLRCANIQPIIIGDATRALPSPEADGSRSIACLLGVPRVFEFLKDDLPSFVSFCLYTIALVVFLLIMIGAISPYFSIFTATVLLWISIHILLVADVDLMALIVTDFDVWFLFLQQASVFFVLWPELMGWDIRAVMPIAWGILGEVGLFVDALPATGVNFVVRVGWLGAIILHTVNALSLLTGVYTNLTNTSISVGPFSWSVQALWLANVYTIILFGSKTVYSMNIPENIVVYSMHLTLSMPGSHRAPTRTVNDVVGPFDTVR